MGLKYLLTFCLILTLVYSISVFPRPAEMSLSSSIHKIDNSCLLYLSSAGIFQHDHYYFNKIMKRLQPQSSLKSCQSEKFKNLRQNQGYPIITQIDKKIENEAYFIRIQRQAIVIKTSSYNGYIYALETLSQLMTFQQKQGKFQISIPLGSIKDHPAVSYRGIMIDTARHFISKGLIYRLVQTMPLVKLNTLHWHFVDDETFSMKLPRFPELTDYSIYEKTMYYSVADFKQIQTHAQKNGIRLIPQIDTPAHVRSWGLSPHWKSVNITIENCPGGEGYNGQFDLSKDQVFSLTEGVIKEVHQIFSFPQFIHLGGDEVSSKCWDLRPEIKNFMKQKGLNTYGQLQGYWRKQLRTSLPQNQKVIYWRNDASGIEAGPNDIIQYWGAQQDIAKYVGNSTNSIIISSSDYLYLNTGQGFIWANPFGTYSVWKHIYLNFVLFPPGVDRNRILGAQVCLWGEVSNEDTFENNLWMRAAAFADRVWNENKSSLTDLAKDLVKLQLLFQNQGVQPSPVTSQYCENNIAVCFPPQNQQPSHQIQQIS